MNLYSAITGYVQPKLRLNFIWVTVHRSGFRGSGFRFERRTLNAERIKVQVSNREWTQIDTNLEF